MADTALILARQLARHAARQTELQRVDDEQDAPAIAALTEWMPVVAADAADAHAMAVAHGGRIVDLEVKVAQIQLLATGTAELAIGLLPGDHVVTVPLAPQLPDAGYDAVVSVNGPAGVLGALTATVDLDTRTETSVDVHVRNSALLSLGFAAYVTVVAVHAGEPPA